MHNSFCFEGETHARGLIIRWKLEDNLVTAALAGELRMGQSTEVFEGLLNLVEREGCLLLDLKELRDVDSRGLGCLVLAAERLGRRMRVVQLRQRLQPLMALCKVLTVLPIASDPAEAVADLRREIEARRLPLTA